MAPWVSENLCQIWSSGELNKVCIQRLFPISLWWQLPFLLMLHNQNKVQHSINPCCQQEHCNNTWTSEILLYPIGIWEGSPESGKGIIFLLTGRKAVGIAKSHRVQITEISPLHAAAGFYLADILTLMCLWEVTWVDLRSLHTHRITQ